MREESALDLITGPLDVYDYLTFLFLLVAIIAFFMLLLFVLGLPGKIAERRDHPHAESVKVMGWAGFLAVIPWIHALIWAFHDSLTIDIRKLPEGEGEEAQQALKAIGATSVAGTQAPEIPPNKPPVEPA
ncbi:MAG: DUF3302 domain-containing protein [Hyphomicrobiales bacterium]